MAVWSQTALTNVRRSFGRIDAEFYRPESLDAFSKVTAASHEQLGRLVVGGYRVVYENTKILEPDGVTETSAGFLQATNVDSNGLSINLDSLGYVAEHDWVRYPKGRIEQGELLVEVKGQAEKVTVVPEGFPSRVLVSGSLFKMTAKPDQVSSWYLFLFLSSRYGRLLRDRLKTNTLIGFVSKPQLYSIPIFLPKASEEEFLSSQARDAFRLNKLARDLFLKAQQLLEAELGLDKLTFQRPVGYAAKLSDVETSLRFDPEHYFPRFQAFRTALPTGISLQPLSECLDYCARGKQPIYAKSGLPVINSKHVQPNRVIQEGNRFALANPDANLQIRGGDTLLNGTGRGTIGRAAPYLADTLAVADNHVTIIRSNCLDPAFLSLYLNSIAGQMQVEMYQRGTSGQLELYPFDIRKVLVWNAPAEFQREIRDLHDKAAAAAQESARLLDQAKTRVEQLIEAAVQP